MINQNIVKKHINIKQRNRSISKISNEDIRKEIANRSLKGSVTVEMSYILPITILLIFLLIHTAFYYHDKAVLSGTATETVEQAVEYARSNKENESLEDFCKERISNKLIFLNLQSVSASISGNKVKVEIKAGRWKFHSTVSIQGNIPYPEKKLREQQRLREEN